jgi:hypothetical protein
MVTKLRGRLPVRLGAATLLVVFGGLVAGCGTVSKSDAFSAFSSTFSKSSTTNASALAQCIVDALYDSGKFNSSEIQNIVTASSTSEIGTDLANRYVTAVTPCYTGGSTTSSSSSSSAASSAT